MLFLLLFAPLRLFELAADGKAAELRKLLAEEAIESVCVMDSGGRTPLNLAILSGNLDAVKVSSQDRERAFFLKAPAHNMHANQDRVTVRKSGHLQHTHLT